MAGYRYDYDVIAQWIEPGERVLDLGCGDGSLLRHLMAVRQVQGYGVENDPDKLLASVKNGINVLQANMERGLVGMEDGFFDHVIMSLSLQAMHNTQGILAEMLRVGREAVVSFPNFGYWRHRLDIVQGHMPVSKELPHAWWNTPNIHLCTVKDFEDLCRKVGAEILDERVLHEGHTRTFLPNLLGSLGVFRFRRRP